MIRRLALLAGCVVLVGGCSAAPPAGMPVGTTEAGAPAASPTSNAGSTATASPATSTTTTLPTTATSAATATTPTASAFPPDPVDPRWRFFTTDQTRYTSAWFAGAHRIMIGFGCTTAPYYAHDPRCPGTQGFHHGIDVVMPCGTTLTSAVTGTVVDPSSAGSPGGAYGPYAFRIRDRQDGVDILVGHVRQAFVAPGQAVTPGQRIALSGDLGAPDGCHLHFEVRAVGGGVSTARDPAALLGLHAHTGE